MEAYKMKTNLHFVLPPLLKFLLKLGDRINNI